MTDFLDFAIPALLMLIGVVLVAALPAGSVLHALGLLCVAGGGFWLGSGWRDT